MPSAQGEVPFLHRSSGVIPGTLGTYCPDRVRCLEREGWVNVHLERAWWGRWGKCSCSERVKGPPIVNCSCTRGLCAFCPFPRYITVGLFFLELMCGRCCRKYGVSGKFLFDSSRGTQMGIGCCCPQAVRVRRHFKSGSSFWIDPFAFSSPASAV